MKYLKFALHKKYFDTGYGVLNYLKYPLFLLGVAVPNSKLIILFAFFYAVICYILGYWWLNSGMILAETEVCNIYNPFVRQMRRKIKVCTKVPK